MTHNEMKQEIESLKTRKMELWRSIKDFEKTTYEEAERIGKVIKGINKKIASLESEIEHINYPTF